MVELRCCTRSVILEFAVRGSALAESSAVSELSGAASSLDPSLCRKVGSTGGVGLSSKLGAGVALGLASELMPLSEEPARREGVARQAGRLLGPARQMQWLPVVGFLLADLSVVVHDGGGFAVPIYGGVSVDLSESEVFSLDLGRVRCGASPS